MRNDRAEFMVATFIGALYFLSFLALFFVPLA